MSKPNKQSKKNEAPVDTQELETAAPVPTNAVTVEQLETMTGEEVIKAFGNKSNAIRGMSALGLKPGPISKKLGIRYQHARNVLLRPLKRVIKEERDAKKGEATTATVES